MPAGNAYPSGHLVPSPILGLANAPIVEIKFLELAMSLLDFSPRIPLGTFSILLVPFAVCSWQYSSQRGVRLKCYYAFFLVCCGCDTSYIVLVHIQSSLHIYTFVVLRAFMAGAASQAGDADSSRPREPCLTSG